MSVKVAYEHKDDLVVTKSNLLIQCSRSEMTTVEMRILLYAIAKIRYTDTELKPITLSITEFARLTEVASESQYTSLREITKRLRSRTIEIFEDNNSLLQTGWLQFARYNTGKGTITLQLEPSLAPQLLQLRKNFTTYALQSMFALDTRYSMQLYELFKSYENLGRWRVEREHLYKLLGTDGYKNFSDFRRFVLEPSIAQINDKTDIFVDYNQECKGKKIVALSFSFRANESNKMLLEEAHEIDTILERLLGEQASRSKERKFAIKWFKLGYREDLIGIAADYCLKKHEKIDFKYIDEMIEQWSADRVLTPAQALDRISEL